jgi:hypothetical protein
MEKGNNDMKKSAKRRRCRLWLGFWTWMFIFPCLLSPFVFGSGPIEPVRPGSLYGLDPELVKLGFYGLLIVALFFLQRSIRQVDRNQSALFNNQRELGRVLTQLVTAHAINHKQDISPPKLSGGGEDAA